MAKLYILPAGSNIRYMCVGLFINSVCCLCWDVLQTNMFIIERVKC